MARDLKKLISEMTLEEKAGMCSGLDFWHLKGVERLGIPSVMVADGPHGLRKQEDKADHLGIHDSIEAVCFPAACSTAASFDRKLLEEMGAALGNECQAEGVSILLGPGVNIKRSPLCGRNFEYFSEDPYLTGELAASHVKGVQSKNVGASVKHFAANNQEYRRMIVSSEIDERTFREIYLSAFETIVKKANPWTLMSSYNKINGVFASENPKLLTDILRDEWGFKGYVMSDWSAVDKRVESLKAGLDLEMPSSSGFTDAHIVQAVKDSTLSEDVLDVAVERILDGIFKFIDNKQDAKFNHTEDHNLAVRIEEESAVLLKNRDNILPLKKGQKIVFIGEYAKKPRYQGGGSSHINSFKVSNAFDEAIKNSNIVYEKGFSADKDEMDDEIMTNAIKAAKGADVVVIFAGLPDSFESEGYDRTHMELPKCQNKLIEAVCEVQANTVIVLHNGSPIEMPWADKVAGILELYLGGQGIGEATNNLLFGKVNPSGKLPESFPIKLSDNPSYLNFPGDGKKVEYKEGIYVGYRYYDKKEMPVLFPFGYGLSYTIFEYSNISLEKEEMLDNETVKVFVDVTNIGEVAGKEIVQLYVKDNTREVDRPIRELKGFSKVDLLPGETKTVEFVLDKRSFAFYNEEIADWYCTTGFYEIQIGKSSREILLTAQIKVNSTIQVPFVITEHTTFGDLFKNPKTEKFIKERFAKRKKSMSNESDTISNEIMAQLLANAPIRVLRSFSGMDDKAINDMVSYLNSLIH